MRDYDRKERIKELSEVTKDDVKYLFFVDYGFYEGENRTYRWVRNPYVLGRELEAHCKVLELYPDRVESFRVHTLEELIVMLDENGRCKISCELDGVDFIPHHQRAEEVFDERYGITKYTLEWHKNRPKNY